MTTTEQFSVLNRWTGAVAFTATIETTPGMTRGWKLRLAVAWAIANATPCTSLDLDGVDFTNYTCPAFSIFVRSSFEGGIFVDSSFVGSSFEGGIFKDSIFVRSSFEGGRFEDSRFVGSSFEGGIFKDSRFVGSSFVGSRFEDSRFEDSRFVRSIFVRSSFEGGIFVDSSFVGSSFEGGIFKDSRFVGSSFEGGRFEDSCFVGSSFVRSRFVDSRFVDSSFEGEPLTQNPICLAGMRWSVTITDAHMQIGCQMHRLSEWAAFDDRTIARMDTQHAREFWVKFKEPLLALAASNGCVFSPSEPDAGTTVAEAGAV